MSKIGKLRPCRLCLVEYRIDLIEATGEVPAMAKC